MLFRLLSFALCLLPIPAMADWAIVDALDLSPFVPLILDALMTVAQGGYEFFVGRGDGIIYILVWGWLAVYMGLYLIKMYFPTTWLGFFGFSGGGEMWQPGGISGFKIGENLLKPALRAIIAAGLLLQVKPAYITDWLVDPFLRFGSLYTSSITESIPGNTAAAKQICPPDLDEKSGWISTESCEFIAQPIADITHANNQIIKQGLVFITKGLSGLMTPIPRGGADFLNIVSGILLVFAFVASNFFMGLLIIQGIFNFGMSLILYPFYVLTWVATKSDKWLDPWPPFDGIITALKELVITMIACAFILVVNIAIVRSLFQWNGSVFVGDFAADKAMGFGQHSILWLSAILTFFLMQKIFELTKAKITEYSQNKNITNLHSSATKDAKSLWGNLTGFGKKAGTAMGWIKGKK
ncbi:MAG: hypothetical protein LBJ18_01930 [Rickettsiales bacterium]|jgi:hypothetical protein|nr:hypothetical protein [Rickettsiales bacterium]